MVENPNSDRPSVNWEGLQSRLEEDMRRFVRRELPKQYPVTVLMLQHFDGTAASAASSALREGSSVTDSPDDNGNSAKQSPVRRKRSLSTASAS